MRHRQNLEFEVEDTIAAMRRLNAPEPILRAARHASLTSTHSAPLIYPRLNSIAGIFESFLKFSESGKRELRLALAALFDLLVGLDYVEYLFTRSPSSSLAAIECEGEVYIPFVSACPRCIIKQNQVVKARGQKPQSAHIGEASSQILSHLLTLLLKRNGGDPSAEVRVAHRTNAEIDAVVVLPQANALLLSEVKASPLVTYPVRLNLERLTKGPTTDDRHKIVYVKASDIRSAFLVLQNGKEIYIGSPSRFGKPGWAFREVAEQMRVDDHAVANYLSNWLDLYSILREARPPSERPIRFFLTHGSGKRNGVNVSDSKNAPGFDRTDDIKKATYQIASMLSKYILGKASENVYVGILSNLGPTSHFEEYLKDILNVALCLPANRSSSESPRYCVPRTHWRYLFDVVLAFDYTFFNSTRLERVFRPLFSG